MAPAPRIITAREWRKLSKGIEQRVRALDRLLSLLPRLDADQMVLVASVAEAKLNGGDILYRNRTLLSDER